MYTNTNNYDGACACVSMNDGGVSNGELHEEFEGQVECTEALGRLEYYGALIHSRET